MTPKLGPATLQCMYVGIIARLKKITPHSLFYYKSPQPLAALQSGTITASTCMPDSSIT